MAIKICAMSKMIDMSETSKVSEMSEVSKSLQMIVTSEKNKAIDMNEWLNKGDETSLFVSFIGMVE